MRFLAKRCRFCGGGPLRCFWIGFLLMRGHCCDDCQYWGAARGHHGRRML